MPVYCEEIHKNVNIPPTKRGIGKGDKYCIEHVRVS
jgi:hypothetical protein